MNTSSVIILTHYVTLIIDFVQFRVRCSWKINEREEAVLDQKSMILSFLVIGPDNLAMDIDTACLCGQGTRNTEGGEMATVQQKRLQAAAWHTKSSDNVPFVANTVGIGATGVWHLNGLKPSVMHKKTIPTSAD
jgi:hypothetical protein